jgi:hypothetical protein
MTQRPKPMNYADWPHNRIEKMRIDLAIGVTQDPGG